MAYCRAVGAEPILQVPLVANNVDGGAATAQTAADMVTYANGTKGYGVKYWEIGNEPDLYAIAQAPGFPIRTAADYCAQFSSYVTAMKAANAAAVDGGAPILFLGPELAQPNVAWLAPFLDGCKDYVDVVTVHRYPFGGTQTSPNGALDDVISFRSALASVASVVQSHARPNTPLGITESNVSYDYANSPRKGHPLPSLPKELPRVPRSRTDAPTHLPWSPHPTPSKARIGPHGACHLPDMRRLRPRVARNSPHVASHWRDVRRRPRKAGARRAHHACDDSAQRRPRPELNRESSSPSPSAPRETLRSLP